MAPSKADKKSKTNAPGFAKTTTSDKPAADKPVADKKDAAVKKPTTQDKPVAKKPTSKKASKKEDDDMDFLNAQVKVANKAGEEAAVQKKADKKKDAEKKEAAEKVQMVINQKLAHAVAQLGPVFVEEVAQFLYKKLGGDKNEQFRDKAYVSFALFNFFNRCLEAKRKVLIKTAEVPEGEAVESFEVVDINKEEGSPHSWNTFKTVSGKTYAVDLTLKQFEPKGRYGYQRDTNAEALGFAVVEGPSRLLNKKGDAAHVGVMCTDGGLFPNAEAKTIVKDGVPEGTSKAYITFLKNAQTNRFHGMNTAEEKAGRTIAKNQLGGPLVENAETLEVNFFEKPLEAQAKKAAAKKEETTTGEEAQ